MGMNVDVLLFDWDEIVDQIVNNGCDNRDVVEEVLVMFGEKICDKYVILTNEHASEDAFCALCHTIEGLFDIEDCCDIIYDLDFEYIDAMVSYDDIEKLAERVEADRTCS